MVKKTSQTRKSIEDYFRKEAFAMTADLSDAGFSSKTINDALKKGIIYSAKWQQVCPDTTLHWSDHKKGLSVLEQLATTAADICRTKRVVDIEYVEAIMKTEARAVVGLIYAKEKGMLRGIPIIKKGTRRYIPGIFGYGSGSYRGYGIYGIGGAGNNM